MHGNRRANLDKQTHMLLFVYHETNCASQVHQASSAFAHLFREKTSKKKPS